MINSILLENTAFELYQSNAYQGTKEALDLAIERIVLNMLKIKGDTPTKQQLDDIKQTINKYISDGYKNVIEDVKTESVEVATITYDYMMLDVATRGIPQTVINDLLKSDREIQGYELKDLFKLSEDNHIRQLKVELSSALAQGLSLPNIVKSMQEKHTNLTKSQLRTNIYTTLTESRESARYAAYKTFEDRGLVKGYRSVSVLDFRTSERCRKLDGVTYYMPLDEVPEKPPSHWNCRRKLSPIVKDSIRSGIRASKFGEVNYKTYGEWFESIPDETKKKFMTPAKWKQYQKGNFKVSSLADISDNKLDLSEIKTILK